MKKIPNISYSAYSTYKSCPYNFYLTYMQNEIKRDPSDEYYAFIGTIWQYSFEKITNDRLYRTHKPHQLISMIEKDIEPTVHKLIIDLSEQKSININGVGFFEGITQQFYLDTTKRTTGDILNEFPTIIPAIKKWLSQPKAILDDFKCEPYFKTKFRTPSGNPFTMSGYVDFFHSKNGIVSIIDGKRNTFVRYDKNKQPKFPFISPIQLHFYVLLSDSIDNFNLLAFWDYTANKIIKVPTSKDDILRTKELIYKTVDHIYNDNTWEKKPSQKNCKFCSFKNHCRSMMSDKGIEL